METQTHSMIPRLSFTLLIISMIFGVAISVSDKDIEECSEPIMTGLSSCLTYAQGGSKAPTTDCCNGVKDILKTNKKCLCVVVIVGSKPDLKLGINATLALGLPMVCNVPANISSCPDLLHLDPNSPEAQIFKQVGPETNSTAKSPNTDPIESPSPSPGTSPSRNGEAKSGRLSLEVIVGGLLLVFFHFKIINI